MAREKQRQQIKPNYDGLSGAQIGQKKLDEFEAWVAEVERSGAMNSWKGKFAGTASRGKIAIGGLGWKSKNPFHQNDRLREAMDMVEKKWFGGPDLHSVESVKTALEHSQRNIQRIPGDASRLASKVSELEAEVRMLRKIVRSYEEQSHLVAMGLPGFSLPK